MPAAKEGGSASLQFPKIGYRSYALLKLHYGFVPNVAWMQEMENGMVEASDYQQLSRQYKYNHGRVGSSSTAM
ncbi:predicted protein [Sclerotinia sclerotiorum 1980 UF-70]|uniref:Uncharacterized protein n=2 Tax=Sclerotinia sclerotiorum (strain ATCC 18683 / 1980 / Ss-1) TaxID=665079 RepID=A7EXA8_SCLS1|nr:predicted protein [Sclerotinia sclerotiorum 1980 UF-70]APA05520.1 hypothetical protein sscle_01g002900 [Sclerotinia sclerotiorum 1980 UF-70]EDN94100.1 predicted protein [Sclerotinia sclerotiorum 1980 UF-70]